MGLRANLPNTHLEAVKMCLELVQIALMGLSCPLISPTGVKLSTFQTFTVPPRQALSSMGRLGTKAKAQTQSLCALGICYKEGGKGIEFSRPCHHIRIPFYKGLQRDRGAGLGTNKNWSFIVDAHYSTYLLGLEGWNSRIVLSFQTCLKHSTQQWFIKLCRHKLGPLAMLFISDKTGFDTSTNTH